MTYLHCQFLLSTFQQVAVTVPAARSDTTCNDYCTVCTVARYHCKMSRSVQFCSVMIIARLAAVPRLWVAVCGSDKAMVVMQWWRWRRVWGFLCGCGVMEIVVVILVVLVLLLLLAMTLMVR
ncbi:Hypothetical predicted protein [Olea europaea subsp. europaea]|uniref:Uncharacterized protein n=1 Tax=Olea europaea subsp. europaea TaxID=158383 RepID=A0A8S0UY49_OLEEU|nr:Hypothetical predicted protein [Olea europaea subsp. europaea]